MDEKQVKILVSRYDSGEVIKSSVREKVYEIICTLPDESGIPEFCGTGSRVKYVIGNFDENCDWSEIRFLIWQHDRKFYVAVGAADANPNSEESRYLETFVLSYSSYDELMESLKDEKTVETLYQTSLYLIDELLID